MKKINIYLTAIMVMLAGLTFTSCEDDDVDKAIDLSGAWTGNMGMYVGVEYPGGRYIEYDALTTDIEFIPHQKYSTHGEGYQTDYYDHHCPYHYTCYRFQWRIENGRIYLRYYDDSGLNANIYDYRLNNSVFEGILEGVGSSLSFRLRKTADYYRYWNDYYSGSWSSYFYIAWDGSYYYDNGYWYGDYYDDYYYYAPTRRDTEAIGDSLNTKELPRVIRHGSRASE